MMLSPGYSLALIAVCAGVTFFTRVFPFLFFRNGKGASKYSVYLGQALPPAVIGMLVIYCLRSTSFAGFPFGLPEVLAVAAVALLHVWKRNNLLSILGGTVLYMLLVQVVFA